MWVVAVEKLLCLPQMLKSGIIALFSAYLTTHCVEYIKYLLSYLKKGISSKMHCTTEGCCLLSCAACRQQNRADLAKSQVAFSVKHIVCHWAALQGLHPWHTYTCCQTHEYLSSSVLMVPQLSPVTTSQTALHHHKRPDTMEDPSNITSIIVVAFETWKIFFVDHFTSFEKCTPHEKIKYCTIFSRPGKVLNQHFSGSTSTITKRNHYTIFRCITTKNPKFTVNDCLICFWHNIIISYITWQWIRTLHNNNNTYAIMYYI